MTALALLLLHVSRGRILLNLQNANSIIRMLVQCLLLLQDLHHQLSRKVVVNKFHLKCTFNDRIKKKKNQTHPWSASVQILNACEIYTGIWKRKTHQQTTRRLLLNTVPWLVLKCSFDPCFDTLLDSRSHVLILGCTRHTLLYSLVDSVTRSTVVLVYLQQQHTMGQLEEFSTLKGRVQLARTRGDCPI